MRQERPVGTRKSGHSFTPDGIIDAMRTPPGVDSLSYVGLKAVSATRLLAICSRTGRDPLLELIQRFACVTTARTFLAFADCAGAYWPEHLMVMRPCCRIVSPDEQVIAQMVDAAGNCDRAGFGQVLDGLVRRERQELLFDRATQLVVLMH